MADAKWLHTLAEVAALTGFSERSLADDCRAGRIEHVHRGRDRLMTDEQIAALIREHTVHPATGKPGELSQSELAELRNRVNRKRKAA